MIYNMDVTEYLKNKARQQENGLEACILNEGVEWKSFQLGLKCIEETGIEVTERTRKNIDFANIIFDKLRIQNDPNLVAAALIFNFVKANKTLLKEVAQILGEDIALIVSNALKFDFRANNNLDKNAGSQIDVRTGILILAEYIFSYYPNKVMSEENYSDWQSIPLLENETLIVSLYERYMVDKLQTIINNEQVNAKIEIKAFGYHGKYDSNDSSKYSPTWLISFRIILRQDKFVYSCWGNLLQEFAYLTDKEWNDDFFCIPKPNGYSALQIGIKQPFNNIELAITTAIKERKNRTLFFQNIPNDFPK
jgi:hypothetical protein